MGETARWSPTDDEGIWRDWWEREEFGPVLVELSMEEMEKREMERTREARRLMRGVTNKRRR
jgi:chromatin structure-remodeling complex subunit SFH1